TYEATGTVRSKIAAAVQSKIVAHVATVLVNEGQLVEAGAPLAVLDAREVEAQRAQAQGVVAEARSAGSETEQMMRAAQAMLEAAQSEAALADATFERYKGLREKGAISQQALDEAQAKQRAAAAEARRAMENLRAMGSRKGEVAARKEQAEAALAQAQTFRDYASILSPLKGIVTRKAVDPGDLASPGVVLFEVEDNERLRLEALVDETHARAVSTGQSVSVRIDAVGALPLAGTISEITPSADPASRTVVVKVDLPPTPNLLSGMFGRLLIASGERQAITIPASALVERGQLTGVYVVDAEKMARFRLVTAGKRVGDRVEILSGLDPGVVIVTDNVDRVADGTRIL
ncbi:MAG TPA: efflux RND transporter periplasmic adaptor subunit, partial [Candidatus Hydrogenedentes bacterium]|nr:efflux RND transporter periplasmic adaptor subunit [Candidatus Hydrogenedentota bacterium]